MSLTPGHYQPTYQPPEGVYLLISTVALSMIQSSPGTSHFRLTEKGYSNFRFILLLLFCVLRLSLVWRHLQSYLDMAHERIEKMKKETGRITNVELQRKVTMPFNSHWRLASMLWRPVRNFEVLFSVATLSLRGRIANFCFVNGRCHNW